jgi:formate dehydrogenase major subunit
MVASFAPTFGRGAMTNTWADIKNANLVVIMGGNAAEAHPCSDLYVSIRAGTDIAWLGGMINYLLINDKIQHEYVKAYTNASMMVKPGFGFSDGLFTGYDAQKRDYDRSSWSYEIGEDGYAKVDETMMDPLATETASFSGEPRPVQRCRSDQSPE